MNKPIILLGLAAVITVAFVVFSSGGNLNAPISWWTLNDTAGNGLDSAGTNPFTDINAVTRGFSGIINNSYQFVEDSGSYATAPTINGLNVSEGSVSAWINWGGQPAGENIFFGIYNISGPISTELNWEVDGRGGQERLSWAHKVAGTDQWVLRTVTGFWAGFVAGQNNWHHLVIVHNGTQPVLYVNGTLASTEFSVSNDNSSWFRDAIDTGKADSISIGAYRASGGNALNFNGSLDEVAIYDFALTATEVSTLYNSGAGVTFPPISTVTLTSALTSPGNDTQTINTTQIFNSTATVQLGNLTNATFYLWLQNNTLINRTTNILTGVSNDATVITNNTIWNVSVSPGKYFWNSEVCGVSNAATPGTTCTFATTNNTFIQGISDIASNFVTTVYETEYAQFNVTFNSSTTPTGFLNWNGSQFTPTITNPSANNWRFDYAMDIPTGVGSKATFWQIRNSGFETNTTSSTQTVLGTNLTLFGASPMNTNYLNFTFKNETVAEESVNAKVSASNFVYHLGRGTVNKTFTLTGASELPSYALAFNPGNRSAIIDYEINYFNSESPSRTFAPAQATFTSTTTNQVLFLLPSSSGTAINFNVISVSQQPIKGATLLLEDSSGNDIAQETTGPSGSAQIFLDTTKTYTLTVSASGFRTQIITQKFTEDFTIQLAQQIVTNATDVWKGVNIDIQPKNEDSLNNNTVYYFNYTINSTFHLLDSFGFTLSNGSKTDFGTVIVSNSSTTNTGGKLSGSLNTGSNSTIRLDYYHIINGTTANSTLIYEVRDIAGQEFSIFRFFSDLGTFLDGGGLFGLNKFALSFIVFTIIFLFTGVLSFKFGIRSPVTLSFMVMVLVIFFDTLDILPGVGTREHVLSVGAVLLFVVLFIREAIAR